MSEHFSSSRRRSRRNRQRRRGIRRIGRLRQDVDGQVGLRRSVVIVTFAARGEGRVRAAQQAAREPFERIAHIAHRAAPGVHIDGFLPLLFRLAAQLERAPNEALELMLGKRDRHRTQRGKNRRADAGG